MGKVDIRVLGFYIVNKMLETVKEGDHGNVESTVMQQTTEVQVTRPV